MSAGVEQPVPVLSDSKLEADKASPEKRVVTLGTIRHRHEHTNEIILVPTPSNDRGYFPCYRLRIC